MKRSWQKMFALMKFVTNVLYLLAVIRAVFPSEDGYGTEWLTYIDESGDEHEMNFSALPAEGRSWRYGSVYFYLYTRKNALDPESLSIPANDNETESNYFNVSNGIKVITHGWLSSGESQWILNMKNSYLDRYDLNVIAVDWSELADNLVYPWSACSTRYVGKQVAKLLDSLVKTFGAQGEQMHLIGHSLGAQVMGNAGKFFGDKIFRITGLDPARPLFEIPPLDNGFRLDESDAQFVDVIHTCAGVYGYETSHGQADYYPNGGKPAQPGCQGTRQAIEACSHGRAYEYFTESIQAGQPFTAFPCKSYKEFENGNCKNNSSLMGDPASENSYGDYYLHTRNESKYAVEDDN